jgi:hypothetical protein
MKFDLIKKNAWGAAYNEDGVLAVLLERNGNTLLLRHVIRGRLDDAAECKNLRKSFAKFPFFVSVGAGHCFSECWETMPSHAHKKKMPASFLTPNASFKQIDDLAAVKPAEIPAAVRTQMEQHCSFRNPAVTHCVHKGSEGKDVVLGAAIPDDAVRQDLGFWAAFGFRMPHISLEAMANLNLYLALDDGSEATDWVLLIHANGSGGAPRTCFQLLYKNQLLLNFEAPCDLLGLGDEPFMQLMDGAVRQASQRCDAFQIARNTLEEYWTRSECDEPVPAALLTRVVFISWAIGNAQDDNSLAGDVEQLNRLRERFEATGLYPFYFDPFESPRLQIPDKYREFLAPNRLMAQQAIGMAVQGL